MKVDRLCGPSMTVVWTEDAAPADRRVPVVLVRESDLLALERAAEYAQRAAGPSGHGLRHYDSVAYTNAFNSGVNMPAPILRDEIAEQARRIGVLGVSATSRHWAKFRGLQAAQRSQAQRPLLEEVSLPGLAERR